MVIEVVLSPLKWHRFGIKYDPRDKIRSSSCSQNPAEELVIKVSQEEKEEGGNWTVIGQPVTADNS